MNAVSLMRARAGGGGGGGGGVLNGIQDVEKYF